MEGIVLLGVGALPWAGFGPLQSILLAYVGPDQILPLTSILGALGGLLLMFWNRFVGVLRRVRNLWPSRGVADRTPGARGDTP